MHPEIRCPSVVRAVLFPLLLVTSTVASVAHAQSPARSTDHARPAVIFPSAGQLPPTPKLWVASPGEPKLAITSGGRRVPFWVDDQVFLADGLRWVAVYPDIRAGSFTVTVDHTQARFTIDPALARRDYAVGEVIPEDEYVHFERVAIDQAGTLTIEARAPRATVLYFLNHDVRADDPSRWVWIGPGQVSNGSTRFELPLARLGLSCASTRSIPLSLYSSGLDGSATLSPRAVLAIDRGRVKLPVAHLQQAGADERWLPCPGASVRTGQPPAPERPAPQPTVSAGEPARPMLTALSPRARDGGASASPAPQGRAR